MFEYQAELRRIIERVATHDITIQNGYELSLKLITKQRSKQQPKKPRKTIVKVSIKPLNQTRLKI